MLIRFVIQNTFSFDEQKEFNMIPKTRLKTLKHHIYSINNFPLLKIASIYGANGAGKSNIIKALGLFQKFVIDEDIPYELKKSRFKFNPKNKNQILAVEFIQNNAAFYYGIEFKDDIIFTEELYLSGLGKQADKLIFERKTNKNKITTIKFSEAFEKDEKSNVLKTVLLEEFVKHNKLVLRLIAKRDNPFLQHAKIAFQWFERALQVITPYSHTVALAHKLEIDKNFKKFADDFMKSFNLGIISLNSEKKKLKDFIGEDNEEEIERIIKEIEKSPNRMIGLRSKRGEEIVIIKDGNDIWVKKLLIKHKGKNDKLFLFELEEESDGTVRLLDFIPAFKEITSERKVFVIDEIERSIHPLLIKELIRKFSLDASTKGQIIFTTHESNLLDQEIFRQDEIWFVEKNINGATDLYSLSDFKEHKTIDIRKGYLNGRYGSIPFLANLHDLNWNSYASEK